MANKRPSVLIVGFHDFWPLQMEQGLRKRYGEFCHFEWKSWPISLSERISFLFELLKTDLLILTTMHLDFSASTIQLTLFITKVLRKRVVKYWIGDDCLAICEQAKVKKGGSVVPFFGSHISHWAASDTLTQTLAGVGIYAQTVVMPSPERLPEQVPPLPLIFSVVGYWTDNRVDSCGAKPVIEAAIRLPDIPFVILGATGKGISVHPANVSFVGNFDDTGQYMKDAVVHVRQYEFDAVPGGTVEEAYYFGRYVIYTYEYPHADYVEYGDVDALVSVIRSYQQKFNSGQLSPNYDARKYVEATWDPDVRFAIMWSEIMAELKMAGGTE